MADTTQKRRWLNKGIDRLRGRSRSSPGTSQSSESGTPTASSITSPAHPRDDTDRPTSDLIETSKPFPATTLHIASQPTPAPALPVPAITESSDEGQHGASSNAIDFRPTGDNCPNEPSTRCVAKSNPTSHNLWKEALSKLGKDEQEFINKVHGDTAAERLFEALSKSIEEKQRDAKLRQRPISAFGRSFCPRDIMVKIVDCIQRFREVGDVAVSFDPVHAALPWAAFRFLLQLITAEAEQTGLLLILLERVGPLVLRGEVYERIYLQPMTNTESDAGLAIKTALIDLYAAVLQAMCVARRLFGQGTFRQALNAVIDPNEIKSLVDKLEDKERTLGAAAQGCAGSQVELLHRNSSKEFRRLQDILDRPLARIDSYLEKMWARTQSSNRGGMLQWISPIPYESDHEFARRDRLEGSGAWLLEREEYKEWKNTSSSTIFWLHGIPGAGKTKLSSKVVDSILSINHETKNDEGLAYFYCDRNRGDRQEPDIILRSLVRQLSSGHKDNTKVIQAMYNIWADQRSKGFPAKCPSIDKCKELLPTLVAAYTQAVIVIDGLDESNPDTRHEFMDLLESILDVPGSLVKIFVASRNDIDLIRQYGGRGHLQVEAAYNQGDIENFVASKIAGSRNPLFQRKLSDETKRLILDTFRDKSQGMFQWAKLQIDELMALKVGTDVKQYLHRLPKGLARAYDKLMNGILEQKGKAPMLAIRAFLWIMGSWRPLTPEELVEAVQQDPDTEGADPSDEDVDLEVVLEACQNLVTTTGPEGEQVCRFSHLSVQEYLELHLEEYMKRHGLPTRNAKTHAGIVCLQVLTDARVLAECEMQQDNPTPFSQSLLVSGRQGTMTDGWFTYVQDCDPESPVEMDELGQLLRRFLGGPRVSSRFYQIWMTKMSDYWETGYRWACGRAAPVRDGGVDRCKPFECTPLGMAFLGLRGALRSWADQIDFSVVSRQNHNLLHLGALEGHREVCVLLLQRGVEVNALNGDGETPLHTAISEGHVSVAELLLEEGRADPNLYAGFSSPLSKAIGSRHNLVARLLAKGTVPDEHAMHEAVRVGTVEVLQQLIHLGGRFPSHSLELAVNRIDAFEMTRFLINQKHLNVNHIDKWDLPSTWLLGETVLRCPSIWLLANTARHCSGPHATEGPNWFRCWRPGG